MKFEYRSIVLLHFINLGVTMGKGDKRTEKGKRKAQSNGNTRKKGKKKNTPNKK
jgi:ribosomal small subunit protein bTHX